jgi:hypothetical protein
MVFITLAWLQSSILGHVNFKLPPKMVPPMCKLRIMNIMSSTISKKLNQQVSKKSHKHMYNDKHMRWLKSFNQSFFQNFEHNFRLFIKKFEILINNLFELGLVTRVIPFLHKVLLQWWGNLDPCFQLI